MVCQALFLFLMWHALVHQPQITQQNNVNKQLAGKLGILVGWSWMVTLS